jgi:hypothetical protein
MSKDVHCIGEITEKSCQKNPVSVQSPVSY